MAKATFTGSSDSALLTHSDEKSTPVQEQSAARPPETNAKEPRHGAAPEEVIPMGDAGQGSDPASTAKNKEVLREQQELLIEVLADMEGIQSDEGPAPSDDEIEALITRLESIEANLEQLTGAPPRTQSATTITEPKPSPQAATKRAAQENAD